MRICVATSGDTLRTIAKKYNADMKAVMDINPHIQNSDANIEGMSVRIPDIPPACNSVREHIQFGPPVADEYAENWIPITPLEQMAQTDYDVLIIGSGAAGGGVLWRLSQRWGNNGKKIGMIEAGDLFLPTHLINIPTYNLGLVEAIWKNPRYSKRIRESYSTNHLPPMPVDYFISNVLGGKTLHWGAACPRMFPFDLSRLHVSKQDMNNYYNVAERMMNVTQEFAKGSAFQEVMLQRLQISAFPEAMDVPMAVDLTQTQLGRLHSNVFFSSIIPLAAALNIRPVDLTVQSRTLRVVTAHNRVTGVEVASPDQKMYTLNAKTVVLAAGSLETPRILLHSGIQGEAIGRYLTNHSRLDAAGLALRSEMPEDLGILNVLIPRTASRLFQMQIHYLNYSEYREPPLKHEVPVIFIPSGLVEPRFDNCVTLDPYRTDEYGIPELRIHLSYSEEDYAVIRQMERAIREAASAMNVRLFEKNGQPAITLRRPGGENHEMGTCRMGINPVTSAANLYGQIHGMSGLYVAGNCVIPTTVAANPTLTAVALAIRTADYIAEENNV
ncbi:GMC oxidoreductase [Paenibacillus sp. y28]|uniref:GMC oxidoreductase n=1 Tax=Paenibacillus sp. y28 TaxID=3129110 RepID=UPI003019BC11